MSLPITVITARISFLPPVFAYAAKAAPINAKLNFIFIYYYKVYLVFFTVQCYKNLNFYSAGSPGRPFA
ncbi:MAG TPA: hypothetical protein DIV41_06510 [Ruminococcaceae bacterium]|nr:hypothetical protein [Oscillospiraceae bacterium]